MQRESPTDATVTTHPSIITKVTVVPDVCAEAQKKYILVQNKQNTDIIVKRLRTTKKKKKMSNTHTHTHKMFFFIYFLEKKTLLLISYMLRNRRQNKTKMHHSPKTKIHQFFRQMI